MLLRLMTVLLLLTLSAPAGVWGAFVHSCDRGSEVKRPPCCQPAAHDHAAPDGTAQLNHRCDIQVLNLDQQRLTNSFKSSAADSLLADLLVSSLPIHPARSFSLLSSITRDPSFSGVGPPVFLRTCSLLI